MTKTICKQQYRIIVKPDNLEFTHVRVEIWYNPETDKRGFYLSIDPIQRKRGIIQYCPSDGILIKIPLTVKRYSDKAALEALRIYDDNRQKLISCITTKYSLEIEEE